MEASLPGQIAALKAQWDAAQPLPSERARVLWQKLRLEWNYNSNHIEGNTLTYGETELVLVHGQTTGNHTLREYEEMKAHDVAIAHVREVAASDRPITEADVRDLNRILLKEPFWKPAITADGQPTQKRIIPGDYKTTPNNVRTATGELFHFATPEETPAKMADLVQWFRDQLESAELPLAPFLAVFHHRFSVIHPFDDGNGRTMRLLINYALLRLGYPPIVIRSEDKQEYLSVLHQADAGMMEPLIDFMARQVIAALELGLKAASGESLEEPQDWKKEMELYASSYRSEPGPPLSGEVLADLIEHSWLPLGRKCLELLKPLTKHAYDQSLVMSFFDHVLSTDGIEDHHVMNEHIAEFANLVHRDRSPSQSHPLVIRVGLVGLSDSKGSQINVFGAIRIRLSEYHYAIETHGYEGKQERYLYDRPLPENSVDEISHAVAKYLFSQVKAASSDEPA